MEYLHIIRFNADQKISSVEHWQVGPPHSSTIPFALGLLTSLADLHPHLHSLVVYARTLRSLTLPSLALRTPRLGPTGW